MAESSGDISTKFQHGGPPTGISGDKKCHQHTERKLLLSVTTATASVQAMTAEAGVTHTDVVTTHRI